MGGFLVLLLKSLVEAPAGDVQPTTSTNDHNELPAFVYGEDGEFLGRVDMPVHNGARKVA